MALPTISVENFGPIRKGTVELRPLTIFTGQSDTGKSWLATLIYSLYSATDALSPVWYTNQALEEFTQLNSDNIPLNFPDCREHWLRAIRTDSSVTFSKSEHSLLSKCMSQAGLEIIFEIERCFGIESYKELESWHTRESTRIKVFFSDTSSNKFPFFEHITKNDGITTNIYFPKSVNFYPDQRLRETIYRSLNDEVDSGQVHIVERLIKNTLLFAYRQAMQGRGCFYFPPGRVGLMESFNSLVPSLIEKYTKRSKDRNEFVDLFPGVLGDFIASLAKIRGTSLDSRDQRIVDTAKRIEAGILEGEVNVQFNSAGMPYIFFKPDDGNNLVPIKLLSSKIKQLAPLVVFLRYIINKESIIIIEEPEVHVHPSKQVELVNQIALLIQEGCKILITTHSEWFFEALRNVIAHKGKNSYPALFENDVGVWNFSRIDNGIGSIVREVEWDQDFGGFQTGFEDTVQSLHNSWVDANMRTV